MGKGNRFKHQGIPEPLNESLVTRKRKDAPPAPGIPLTERSRKKRRQELPGQKDSFKLAQQVKHAAHQGPRQSIRDIKPAKKKSNGLERINGKLTQREEFIPEDPTGKWSMSGGLTSSEEDDNSAEEVVNGAAEDSSDAIDDPDVMEDGLDGLVTDGLDDVDDDEELVEDDDFLGLDDDDSVIDSDVERRLWSDEDDEEEGREALNKANIVGLSRQLDKEKAIQEAEAQAELEEAGLQTNITGEGLKVLEDDDDEASHLPTNLLGQPNLQLLRSRITDTIRVLDDFSKLAEAGRSRAEYTSQLLKDICTYYGYSPFLAEKLFNLFSPSEAFAFFEANEQPRPIVIRTNTLRTNRRELAQALINRGVTLEPLGKWSKVGLQIFESQVPLGATPEYLAGHYILQAASSFLPVMALAPQEHERVLDMAAAPGGKSTYIAALMKNTGCVFANDSNKLRAKGLIGNIHRLGVKNTIVSNCDGMAFPKVIGGFDRVLLDAPCSGTGVIAKDASVKTNKTEKDFMRLPHLQKQLLLCAIDSVDHSSKTGGYIVYSTCSVTVEENEQVVQYALNKRPNIKLVSTELDIGREGFTSIAGKQFHPSLKLTRRYYPHTYNVDGFFVAKFKKIGPTLPNATRANGVMSENVSKTPGPESFDHSEVEEQTEEGEEANKEDEDDFGGWDEEEDAKYMERAMKRQLKKKGLNPKTAMVNGKAKVNGANGVKNVKSNGVKSVNGKAR